MKIRNRPLVFIVSEENQITPVSYRYNKNDYLIKDTDELIEQLESLRTEASLQVKNRLCDPVFYKDFNALTITIKYLKECLNYEKNYNN